MLQAFRSSGLAIFFGVAKKKYLDSPITFLTISSFPIDLDRDTHLTSS
jgi:hypothetical protein